METSRLLPFICDLMNLVNICSGLLFCIKIVEKILLFLFSKVAKKNINVYENFILFCQI